MFDLPHVVRVRHLGDHRLRLRFNDGVEGTVDLGDALSGPMLEPLRDPALFAQVRIDGQTIAWPNGADWAPESLRARVLAPAGTRAQEIDDHFEPSNAHRARMPDVSRFFGIIVRMFYFYDDHESPHFRAVYGEYSVAIEVEGHGIRGRFPPNRLMLVYEWRDRHREELMENWRRLRDDRPVVPIEPLS